LLASRLVGAKGRVVAFEPSPREVKRLRWNLMINRCNNCLVEQLAVGSTDQDADLYVCLGQRTGFNSLRLPDAQEPTLTITVHTTNLDKYVSEHKIDHVDFLKIDVEGGELEVLKGGVRILDSGSPPVILCEVQDLRTRKWGYEGHEILEFLEHHDYQPFSLAAKGRLRPCMKKAQYDENLVFVPRTRLHNVADCIERARESEENVKIPQ
nr:FkbM family methyltransferase [Candidatus Njordarchaeum guaymaensis]